MSFVQVCSVGFLCRYYPCAVQVMSHSGGGQAADRTPFYGVKVPVEVKKLVQLSKGVERSTMKEVLKGVVFKLISSCTSLFLISVVISMPTCDIASYLRGFFFFCSGH